MCCFEEEKKRFFPMIFHAMPHMNMKFPHKFNNISLFYVRFVVSFGMFPNRDRYERMEWMVGLDWIGSVRTDVTSEFHRLRLSVKR